MWGIDCADESLLCWPGSLCLLLTRALRPEHRRCSLRAVPVVSVQPWREAFSLQAQAAGTVVHQAVLSGSSAGHKELHVTRRDTSASLVIRTTLGKGRPLHAGHVACQLWSRWRAEGAPWLTLQSAAKVQSALLATKQGTPCEKCLSCACMERSFVSLSRRIYKGPVIRKTQSEL